MSSRNSRAPRALLVEDQVLIALCEERALADSGFEVVKARTGEEALALIGSAASDFDAALFDIELGDGIDGVAAAKELRKVSSTPIFFVSALPKAEVARKAGDLEGWTFIPKSSMGPRLAQAVLKALAPLAGAGEEGRGDAPRES